MQGNNALFLGRDGEIRQLNPVETVVKLFLKKDTSKIRDTMESDEESNYERFNNGIWLIENFTTNTCIVTLDMKYCILEAQKSYGRELC